MEKRILSKKITIGVLFDSIDEWYQNSICKGIKKQADNKNLNVLFFSGMGLKYNDTEDFQHNAIYQLVNTNKLDGLIISKGALSDCASVDEIKKFINKYNAIPVVSISIALEGIHSIVFNNSESMHLMLNHLIKDHNYRKIAYISGPTKNHEAILRYRAYEEVLIKYNIPINKNLVVEGDFLIDSGADAAKILIKDRMVRPDVIVCANDAMAIGAYISLEKMGIKVGKDIALTGFDDIEAGRTLLTPITTISQPMFEMGLEAVKVVTDLIGKKDVPYISSFSGKLIIKESCSCFNITRKKYHIELDRVLYANKSYIREYEKSKMNIKKKQNIFINLLIENFSIPHFEEKGFKDIFNKLIDMIIIDIRQKKVVGNFINYFNFVLNDSILVKKHDYLWDEALSSLRKYILEEISDYEISAFIQELFFNASILLGKILSKGQLLHHLDLEKFYIESSKIIKNFNSALHLTQLTKVIYDAMSLYGIEQYYLCLYEKPIKHMPNTIFEYPPKIKIVLGHNKSNDINMEYFKTIEMLPDELIFRKEKTLLIFMSLFSGIEHFGYIVFGIDEVVQHVFENLREHISNTLKSETIFYELSENKKQLTQSVRELTVFNKRLNDISTIDELTGLYNRRGFNLYGDSCYKSMEASDKTFLLLFGDIDGLKIINDTYGHLEGDEAIRIVARILKDCFSKYDIISRIGGDEFTVMTVITKSQNDVNEIMKHINHNFNNHNSMSNKPYEVNMSFGYSVFSPEIFATFEEHVKQADSRLYEQKKIKKLK